MCEKRRLILATHNEHKTQEIRDLIISEDLPYEVVSLHEIGDDLEIEETGETLMENSQLKAETCHRRHHIDCFADDTGWRLPLWEVDPGSTQLAMQDRRADRPTTSVSSSTSWKASRTGLQSLRP